MLCFSDESMHLQFEISKLEKEATNLYKRAKKEQEKAKNLLKDGNVSLARVHAENSSLFEHQAEQILQKASFMTDMYMDSINSEITDIMKNVFEQVSKSMKKHTLAFNEDEIKKTMDQYNEAKQKSARFENMLLKTSNDRISERVQNILDNIENELMYDPVFEGICVGSPEDETPSGVKF